MAEDPDKMDPEMARQLFALMGPQMGLQTQEAFELRMREIKQGLRDVPPRWGPVPGPAAQETKKADEKAPRAAAAAAAGSKKSPAELEAELNERLGGGITVEACTPDSYVDFLARMMSEPEEGVVRETECWVNPDIFPWAKEGAGGPPAGGVFTKFTGPDPSDVD
eukprot:Rhum_TRINITY_DN14918_c9_g2::Rhum_TRINITY_DN14918_c9_g2_i1::g.127999::m.127999